MQKIIVPLLIKNNNLRGEGPPDERFVINMIA